MFLPVIILENSKLKCDEYTSDVLPLKKSSAAKLVQACIPAAASVGVLSGCLSTSLERYLVSSALRDPVLRP